MKRISLLFVLFIMGIGFLVAQKNITGKVTDEKGMPVIGANIVVKGGNVGTITDYDGMYKIALGSGFNVLTFSYTGYETQDVAVGNLSEINVKLVEGKLLEEIVVTALGLERKRNDLSVSAQQVSGDDINKVRSNNFVSNLSGKVAGLDVRQNNAMGGSTNVVLRGSKSITGNNQALFVIDGVPVANNTYNTANTQTGRAGYDYGSSIADINPDDIQSVNVLKGAAAALYGSRGANGVILITTKKGGKDRFGVTINSSVTVGTIHKSTAPEYQKEYGAGYYPAFYESDLFSPGTNSTDYVDYQADASYGPKFDPNLQVYDWRSLDPKSAQFGKKSPWVAAANGPDKFYETSLSSNQSILFEGGGSTSQYKVGYTRNDEKGMMPNSSLNKNLINIYGAIEPNSKFKISSSINFSNTNAVGRYGSGYDNANPNTMFRQWFQTNVDILDLKEAYERNGQNVTWNWAAPAVNAGPIYWDNPYFMRHKSFQSDSRYKFFGNITTEYKILPDLKVIGRLGGDMSFDKQEERRNKASVDLGAYSVRNNSNKEFNYDLFLNYNRDLTNKITFDATAGTNIRRNFYSSIFSTTNTDLVSDGLYTIGNSAGVPVPPVEVYEPAGVNGLFATAGFTYDKTLAIDATFRRDQSTTLPAGNNSFFYPSVSASYVFSNKLKLDWLSYGKVRASYAEVGNDAPPLSVYDVYDKPTAFGTVALFSLPARKNNSQLKPERTKSLEFGLDASFFDNRVGFELSYYDARTVDQIIPIQVSGATGYTSKFINSGEVRNKGIELIANFTPIRKKDFVWKFNINYSRNQNEVVSLFDANTKQIVIATFQSGVSLVAIPGQPFGVLKGRGYSYTNGQKTVNEDGYYVSKTDQIIGNVTPKWQGGVGTSLTFGALTLSCLVDMKIGGSLYSLDQAYGQYTGMYPNTAGNNDLGKPKRSPVADGGGVILDGVKEDGTKNDIRVSAEDSDVNPYGIVNNPNEAFVYDASYVKLRELNVTYSIPAKWFNGKTIKGIDVSLIGRNLWIIHKNLPYADPEEVYSAGNVTGHQGGAYPTLRTVGFNLKFKL